MLDKIFFLGFGLIPKSILDIWNVLDLYKNCEITIVEPVKSQVECWPYLFRGRDVVFINHPIKEDNIELILDDATSDSLIIDLTVEVDSLFIMEYCAKHNLSYINTSLENYENLDECHEFPAKFEKFKENTLLCRHNLQENQIKTKRTMISNFGMNPGLISAFALRALTNIAFDYGYGKPRSRQEFAKLCKDLKVRSITCCEIDTTQLGIRVLPDTFYNTWSPLGMQSEAGDYVCVGVNKSDWTFFDECENLIKPDVASNIRFIAKAGFEKEREGITMDPAGNLITFTGSLIPHMENVTLNEYLSIDDYSPTTYYCYKPCPVTVKCLKILKKREYRFLTNQYGVSQTDMTSGYDSIASCVTFENGSQYICGTVVSLLDVKNLGLKFCTPTSCQVAAGLHSAIKYMLIDKNKGLLDAEEIQHEILIKGAEKFLGKTFARWV